MSTKPRPCECNGDHGHATEKPPTRGRFGPIRYPAPCPNPATVLMRHAGGIGANLWRINVCLGCSQYLRSLAVRARGREWEVLEIA